MSHYDHKDLNEFNSDLSNWGQSVDAGELISAGVQFTMFDPNNREISQETELSALESAIAADASDLDAIATGIIERSYREAPATPKKQESIEESIEPPLSTLPYWVGPYEVDPELEIPEEDIELLCEIFSKVGSMSPAEVVRDYFKLGIGNLGAVGRNDVQEIVREKCSHLFKAMHHWHQKMIEKINSEVVEDRRPEALEALRDTVAVKMELLNRTLATEESPELEPYTREPVINDQYSVLDEGRSLDRERDAHIDSEKTRRFQESEDWSTRMWNRDDSKNISGEEALYYRRCREANQELFWAAKRWIYATNDKDRLKKALKVLHKRFSASQKRALSVKNWAEVRYTKKQYYNLKAAIQKQINSHAWITAAALLNTP